MTEKLNLTHKFLQKLSFFVKTKEFLFEHYILTKFSCCSLKLLVHKKETNCSKIRENVVADQISAYVIYEWPHRLFGYVMTCCNSTTSHDFQSFQALKIWSSKLKLSRSEILMEEKSDRLQSLLNLINSNWGSPLKGITELLTDTLQNVLQMVNSPQVDRELLENSLKCLSWKTKAKYSLLAVILPRIGVIKILENKPNFTL